jgi:uncharacterized protein YvpB
LFEFEVKILKKKVLLAATAAAAFIAAAAVLAVSAGEGSLAAIDGEAAEKPSQPLVAQTPARAEASQDEPEGQTGAQSELAQQKEAQSEPAQQTEFESEPAQTESESEPAQQEASEAPEAQKAGVSQTGVSEQEKSFESRNALAMAGKAEDAGEAQPEFEVRDYESGLALEPAVAVFSSRAKPALAYEKGSFAEAAAFARTQPGSVIYWSKSESIIWDNSNPLPDEKTMKVEKISQLPELPRGCEVTSLAMLLSARGISADKLELAERIAKDNTPLEVEGGKIYFGDPNKGFVGSIYDLSEDGYGVYHKPICDLLQEYEPDAAIDLTGCEFEDVLRIVAAGNPVWVVINSWYQELPESQFETWHVPGGELKATYREHSVLVTGYDSQRIFFNDPLLQAESALREDFIKAWVQMGRQAVAAAG